MKRVFFAFLFLLSSGAFCSFKLSKAPIFLSGEINKIRVPHLVSPFGKIYFDIAYKEIHFFSTKNEKKKKIHYILFGSKQEGGSFRVSRHFSRFLKFFVKYKGKELPFESYLKEQDQIAKEFFRLHRRIVRATRKKVLSSSINFVESKMLYDRFHSFHQELITP